MGRYETTLEVLSNFRQKKTDFCCRLSLLYPFKNKGRVVPAVG